MTQLISECICGQLPFQDYEIVNGLQMRECNACGVMWQHVRMTESEYAQWYATKYHDGIYTHTYAHDRQIAALRLRAYGIAPGSQVLDVGCGNNAFVDECRVSGLNAVGQDHASQADAAFTYAKPLRDCCFPTASFDVVTMHDVLEHVPDIRSFLREVRRILRPDGRFLLDWPAFHAPNGAGLHHWKPVEHLWMLTDGQLQQLLEEEGFRVYSVAHPLPSRSVFQTTACPPAVTPAQILVPAGIGDGYWVLTKLRGFIRQEGLHLPEIYVHDAGPRRSGEFWQSVPFVRFAGYSPLPPKTPFAERAFTRPGYVVQRDVPGMDYFISLNGALESGQSLDEALPGPTEWYPPLFHSKEEGRHTLTYRARYGEYVVAAFWNQGFYQKWLREFSLQSIVRSLQLIMASGRKVVIMGAGWDRDGIASQIASADRRFVSLVGETSYPEMVGLIRGAAGVFGFPAGNTLMGAFMKRPTLLLWNQHFKPAFWRNVCPPNAPHYKPLPTSTSARLAVRSFLDMLGAA